MRICLPAGKKRLYRNTPEKLKNRTNVSEQFLLSAAMLSLFFFTTISSHAHVRFRSFKLKFNSVLT